MSSDFETIRSSIESFFNTGWGTKTAIEWDQVPYEPEAGDSYVKLWIKPVDLIQTGLGSSPPFRVFGIAQVDINCPLGTGTKTIAGYADSVKDIFLGKQTTSGVAFRNLKVFKTEIGEWQRWCLSFNFYKDITT